ncbi:MAG: hypothetical protein AB8B55_24525 [Mariniblastus sp.]
MPRFSLKLLFILVTAFGIGFGFLAAEPLGTATAALFCFIACCTLPVLLLIVIDDLTRSLKQRNFASSGFSIGYRLTFASSTAFLLMVMIVVISNFVLESSISHGRSFTKLSWFVGPIIGLTLFVRIKKKRVDRD